jgi:hypothetical protein
MIMPEMTDMPTKDFINATNNGVSGLWVLVNNQNLTDGPNCVAN